MHQLTRACTTALLLLAASSAQAGRFNEVLDIGDKAPDWTLTGTDDKPHKLADYAKAKAVVVLFTCNHCPVASGYEDRLIALQKAFQEQGLHLVAISASKMESDDLPAMKERAKEKGFNFPYLHDETQQVAKSYGASATPHVFVLDADRKVAYMGAIDDSILPAGVKKPYLIDAVRAVLSGKQPEMQETRPVGCPIVYESP